MQLWRDAAAVVAMLACVACGTRTEPVMPHAEPIPEVARVVCEKDGSTSLASDSVIAQPDGVHIEVDNRTGEGAQMIGLLTDVGEGTTSTVVRVPPGSVKVACYPYSQHEEPAPKGHAFEILDPNGHWVSPELQCPPGGMVASTISDFGEGSGQKGDPVDITRENLEGLEPDDVVERAGYPESEEPVVRVVRDGKVVATTGFHRATGGGWNMGNSEICDGLGIHQS